MSNNLRIALEHVLQLARCGANETYTNREFFEEDMKDIVMVETELLRIPE